MACFTSPNLGTQRVPVRVNLYWYWTIFLVGVSYERIHGVKWTTINLGFLAIQIECGELKPFSE